jgi:hypothetical protein
MAYKLTHREAAQELRFPTQHAAKHYADRYGGGVHRWTIAVATLHGADRPHPTPIIRDAADG